MSSLSRTVRSRWHGWSRRLRRSRSLVLTVAGSLLLLVALGGGASAAGGAGGGGTAGTAKPVPRAAAPFVEQTLPTPAFSVDPTGIHGFTELGFLQKATVDGSACPGTPAADFGGTAVINNVTITVPCNMTIQMPANTLTWADFVNADPKLGLDGSPYPSFELQVFGNVVGATPTSGRHIAGLMFFSQQSVNAGSGYIKAIDYGNGSVQVDNGGDTPVTVQLNDPVVTTPGDPAQGTGRFSAGQSPDPRLSVDQGNPTVTAATGYPMCIPRTDPAGTDDPRCPRVNRPLTPTAPAVSGVPQGCRNWLAAGVVPPKSGEMPPPAAGQVYCSAFVMPDPATRKATDPDARQQAPFAVGDHVVWAGTLVKKADGSTYVSAHTLRADVDVFTQPGTTPSYLSIEGSLVGSADPVLTSVTGVAQEPRDRLVLEAATSDPQSVVDAYLPDIDPKTGAVRNRWVTPQAMTGETNMPNGGGIGTQFTGPQPERARLRANKAPTGLLSNPTRTLRVSNRYVCKPTDPVGQAFDGTSTTAQPTDVDTCLKNVPLVANGLQAGVYTAPVFNFVFPENIRGGDPVVPYDFWHLGFLRYGEGPNGITPAVGPLTPAPW